MMKGAEEYSPATNRLLARCISKACAGESAYASGFIPGKRLHEEEVSHHFIHQSFNHAEARVLRHLQDDTPAWWKEVISDSSCNACLRANAPHLGPRGHLPQDNGLLFLDVWHCSVGEIITQGTG